MNLNFTIKKNEILFNCGCSIPINHKVLQKHGKKIEDYENGDVLPNCGIDIKYEKINKNCPEVWKMLARGCTKGVFQLESQLGKQWTKRLRPTSIEHIGALGAILRPGCLECLDEEGISTTEHYCARKNKEEVSEIFHPSMIPALEKTYNVMIYQEQAMKLSELIAGFNLQEADMLRKAIGKKLPEEMAKCKKMFIEGAKKLGVVTEQEAEIIFDMIEKSQRYSFNKSHAFSYGVMGYWTAYAKAHFPLRFFTSWLRFSSEKQHPLEEIRELVDECKLLDIEVLTPKLQDLKKHFYIDGEKIRFGLSDIKGIGESQVDKIRVAIKQAEEYLQKPFSHFSWYDFVLVASDKISVPAITNLISVGAIQYGKYESNRNASGVQSLDNSNRRRKEVDSGEKKQLSLFD